ncbi:MAG: DNA polymerase III subunit epsilon [Burkholderiales bacterium]|jgi:DNA polymerase-3 subunit epsilon|nr:DNA polymerase III subunit epsilon [Burkholderiales bacterium]
MRQIVLDTETTGLAAREGHRIIEVGAIEIVGRRVTDRRLHHYVNPERDSDEGALAVHGLTSEFLADKAKFAEIADELLAFVRDAEVIIHNASFDLEFLDEELKRIGRAPFAGHCLKVTDSLTLARELHPGKRNSLDALCERYGVSNRHRTLHGALLDAGLLAEVYLAMTRGQDSLVIDLAAGAAAVDTAPLDPSLLRVLAASAAEVAAHEAVLDGIEQQCKGGAVWRRALSAAD